MIIAIGNYIGNNRRGSDGNTPINTVAPVISGTPLVGNTLTSTTGTWISDTGILSYSYRWTRDGVAISGATNSTYTLTSTDLHTTILCQVAATDSDGTSAYVNSNSLVIYVAEYKAVLDYATTQGYTLPTVSQRLKQSILLNSLKTGGIWTKLDTFVNFATDGSSAFALIDWKRLVQYTAVNSPTFTTNQGFTGNGTSSYISTNFNAVTQGTNYIQDNASRYVYMFAASGTGALDGKSVASINNMTRASTGNQRINQGTTGLVGGSFDFTTTQGMKSIHRTSSTNVELFNGTTQASRTALSAGMNSNSQFVLRSGSVYGAHTISMYANGASLVSENTAFVNAFNTYITSI
jgi:hypothetical protein